MTRAIDPTAEHAVQTHIRLSLYESGYLRPLSLCEKRPWIKAWNSDPITPEVIKGWPVFAWGRMTSPALTTGIQPMSHGHNIVWIDSDVSDARGAATVLATARQCFGRGCVDDMPLRHSGRKTYALLLRSDRPLPYARTQTYIDAAGDPQKVELIGEAAPKQMAVYGPHTYRSNAAGNPAYEFGRLIAEREYAWGERTPLNTPPDKLPYASVEAIEGFLRAVNTALRGDVRYKPAEPVSRKFESGAEFHPLRDDTIINTAKYGAVNYPDLLSLCLTQGSVRCSMSFLSAAHTNPNKGIASIQRIYGHPYVGIYDFEEETTHRHITLSPGHLDYVRRSFANIKAQS